MATFNEEDYASIPPIITQSRLNRILADFWAIVSGFTPEGAFRSPYNYLIDYDGTDYYANNAYQTVYGGPDDAGGVDGGDLDAVVQQALYAMEGTGTLVFAPSNTYEFSTNIRLAASAEGSASHLRVCGARNAIIKAGASFPDLTPGVPPIFYFPPSSQDVEICGLTFDTNVPESADNTIAIFGLAANSKDVKIHHNTHINPTVTGLKIGDCAGFVTIDASAAEYAAKDIIITDNVQCLPVTDFTQGSWLANLVYVYGANVANNSKLGMDTLVRTQNSKAIGICNNKVEGLCVIADIQGSNHDITITGNRQRGTWETAASPPFGAFPGLILYMRALANSDEIIGVIAADNIAEGEDSSFSSSTIAAMQIFDDGHSDCKFQAKITDNIIRGTGVDIGLYLHDITYGEVTDKIDVTNNNFIGSFSGAVILDSGGLIGYPQLRLRGNTGYVSENHGTATITAGTSVVVNHGLSTTPQNILITPYHSGAGLCWADTPTSTQFTIHSTNSGTWSVYWRATISP